MDSGSSESLMVKPGGGVAATVIFRMAVPGAEHSRKSAPLFCPSGTPLNTPIA